MKDIILRFVGFPAPELFIYSIKSHNGTTLHVYGARMIRIFAESLHARHDVVTGNISEILNLIKRSEVDLTLTAFVQADLMYENISFSYPTTVSEWSFMTTKPEPVHKSFAILHPFSYSTWIALATAFISLTLLFYIYMNGKMKYLSILFEVLGSLLEQSVTFQVGRNNSRIILTAWLLGAMIISYGYKAVLLSSLTFPSTTVIRDIPDFIKAVSEGPVKCFGNFGNISLVADYGNEAWRTALSCLERTENHDSFLEFQLSTSKKIIMSEKALLSRFERDFFVSEDSFTNDHYIYPVSKKFCCLKKLNTLILRMQASGIYIKLDEEEKYQSQHRYEKKKRELNLEEKSWEIESEESSGRISFSDISGAFFILLFGWFLALLTLIAEIFMNKYGTRNV